MVSTPIVAGTWRPAVLLPARLACEPGADLERILRHELAHVKRGDDWTNLLQQGIRASLFFHPGVWWLSRRLTVDREIACDDFVLAASRSRRDYALLLTDFASRTRGRSWAAAPGAWSSKHQLKERISMILDSKRNASTHVSRRRAGALCSAAVLAAAVALYAAPRLALAGDSSSDEAPAAAEGVGPVAVNATDESSGTHHATITFSHESEVETTTGPGARAKIKGPQGSTVVVSPRVAVQLDPAPVIRVEPKLHGKVRLVAPAVAPAGVTVPVLPHAPPGPAVYALAPDHPEPRAVAEPPARSEPPRPGRAAVARERRVEVGASREESLERRLERLERLVESFLRPEGGPEGKGQTGQPAQPPQRSDEGKGKGEPKDKAEMEHLKEHLKGLADHFKDLNKLEGPGKEFKDLEKLKELGKQFKGLEGLKDLHGEFKFELKGLEKLGKDATAAGAENLRALLKEHPELGSIDSHMETAKRVLEQVAREVERAAREAQRAVEAGKRQREQARNQRQSASAASRRALEQQRKALERQMGQIEAQLERLDSELDRVEDELEAVEDQEDSEEQEAEEQADKGPPAENSEDGNGDGNGEGENEARAETCESASKPTPAPAPEPKRREQ
jgi:hypothetical protein